MAAFHIRFNGTEVASALKSRMKGDADRLQAAVVQAAQTAADNILELGRADIASGGAFGARWILGFHADMVPLSSFGGKVGGATIVVSDDVPYFRIFEYGGTIYGKPMLWIPLSGTDAVGIWARDYPGGLFRLDRTRPSGGGFKGQKRDKKTGKFTGGFKAPLLLSVKDGQPKYFGKSSVFEPQKFHIRDICAAEAKKMGQYFKDAFGATAMG